MHRPIYRSKKVLYTLAGILFGFCFPLVGMLLDIFLKGGSLNWKNLAASQINQPLLWVIDCAPLFLGVAFFLVGAREDRLTIIGTRLEQMVAERTDELSKVNGLLKKEIEKQRDIETLLARGKKEWEALFDAISDPVILVDEFGTSAALQPRRKDSRLQIVGADH